YTADEGNADPFAGEEVDESRATQNRALFFAEQHRCDPGTEERPAVALLEKVERPTNEERRERQKVKVVEDRTLKSFLRQVDECKRERREIALQAMRDEGGDRKRRKAEDPRLHDEQGFGTRAEGVERNEGVGEEGGVELEMIAAAIVDVDTSPKERS